MASSRVQHLPRSAREFRELWVIEPGIATQGSQIKGIPPDRADFLPEHAKFNPWDQNLNCVGGCPHGGTGREMALCYPHVLSMAHVWQEAQEAT